VVLATTGSAIGLFLLMRFAPLPAIYLSLGGMVLGLLVVIPFIWPEVRLLLNLGGKNQG
jgi:hypothetical protein